MVDLWHRLSTSGVSVTVPLTASNFVCQSPGCFRVSFGRVLDNDGLSVRLVAANRWVDRNGSPSQPTVDEVVAYNQGNIIGVAGRKNQYDIVGHEYAHRIENFLRRSRANDSTTTQNSFGYLETMMDAEGEINEGLGMRLFTFANNSNYSGTVNWALNGSGIWDCPTTGDPHQLCQPSQVPTTPVLLVQDWPRWSGGCTDSNTVRKRTGRLLYMAWQSMVSQSGSSSTNTDFDFYFGLWSSNVLRSHHLTKTMAPTLLDFYAATVARQDSSGGVVQQQERLTQILEADRVAPSNGSMGCF